MHNFYVFKGVVSILSTDIAFYCTNHQPDSLADIDIFYKNSDFHDVALLKSGDERKSQDIDSGLRQTTILKRVLP